MRLLGDEHRHTWGARSHLAIAYQRQGRLDVSITLHEKVGIGMKRTLGSQHFRTLRVMSRLAAAYREWFGDSINLLESVVKEQRRINGEKHLDTVLSVRKLELAYHEQSKP